MLMKPAIGVLITIINFNNLISKPGSQIIARLRALGYANAQLQKKNDNLAKQKKTQGNPEMRYLEELA